MRALAHIARHTSSPGLALAVLLATSTFAGTAAGQEAPAWAGLPAEVQILLAVQAAPAEMRDGATVQGVAPDGSWTTLREGTNGLICMAPNPASEQLEVSCHHETLEPFFARGRELLAEGITGEERVRRRWEEYEAGSLPIPFGAINYILTGSGFDPEAGALEGAYLRWTIYTPGATPRSTGITDRFNEAGPWLMFPGTPGSHIMITPPRAGGR